MAAVWSKESPESELPSSPGAVGSLGAVGSRYSGVSSLRGVSLIVRPFGVVRFGCKSNPPERG